VPALHPFQEADRLRHRIRVSADFGDHPDLASLGTGHDQEPVGEAVVSAEHYGAVVVDVGDALVMVVGEGFAFPGPRLLERERGGGIAVPVVRPVRWEPAQREEAAIFRRSEG
jgi:hypothetical protein